VGTINVLLVVSDGDLRFGRRLAIEVKKSDQPSPTPLVTFGPTASPSPTPGPSVTPTPAVNDTLPIQVGNRSDGDDDDSGAGTTARYEDPEETGPGSTVTYRIVIDNDSNVEVSIESLIDDVHSGIVCTDSAEDNVVGQTLAPDDGDAEQVTEKGDDAIVCTFTAPAPQNPGDRKVSTVTVRVKADDGQTGSDRDSATVIVI
jgi:hypothetical protein